MALIKCTECGKTFSDKAACCPECACPTEEVLKAIEEYAEKKRVEDEKRRITEEAEKKKADEEKRAARAEAERIREEKEQAAKQKFERDMIEWKDRVEKIKLDREKAREQKIREMQTDASEARMKLLQDKEEKMGEIERKINDLRIIIDCDKGELEKCSVLDIRKKKDLKRSIESNTVLFTKAEDEKKEIQNRFLKRMSEIDEREKSSIVSIEKVLDVEFPFPESPEEIEIKERLAMEKKEGMLGNTSIKSIILDTLTSEPVTITELKISNPQLEGFTNQKINVLLRELVMAGKVDKTKDGKKTLYSFHY